MLKKYINLSEYSAKELSNFTHSVGIQLFYEHGWECWLALIPIHKIGTVKLNKDVILLQTYNAFQSVRIGLRKKLAELALSNTNEE